MIDRRCALCRISVGILGGGWALVGCSPLRPNSAMERGNEAATWQGSLESLRGPELLAELERLEKRVYSEEGIPMLLACADLEPRSANHSGSARSSAANTRLAENFRQLAEALPTVRPNLTQWDVAKIVELLADRDFHRGGKDGRR